METPITDGKKSDSDTATPNTLMLEARQRNTLYFRGAAMLIAAVVCVVIGGFIMMDSALITMDAPDSPETYWQAQRDWIQENETQLQVSTTMTLLMPGLLLFLALPALRDFMERINERETMLLIDVGRFTSMIMIIAWLIQVMVIPAYLNSNSGMDGFIALTSLSEELYNLALLGVSSGMVGLVSIIFFMQGGRRNRLLSGIGFAHSVGFVMLWYLGRRSSTLSLVHIMDTSLVFFAGAVMLSQAELMADFARKMAHKREMHAQWQAKREAHLAQTERKEEAPEGATVQAQIETGSPR